MSISAQTKNPAFRRDFFNQLFAEAFNIVVDAVFNNAFCFGCVANFVNNSLFVFKSFINFEEVHHFAVDMGGDFGDIVISVIGRVIERNSDNFFVCCAVIGGRRHLHRFSG